MSRSRTAVPALAAAVLAVFAAGISWAESDDAAVDSSDDETAARLEPVVVTATKRDELLRSIAGSVAAARGASLETLGARDLEGELKLVPGVSLNKEMADRSDPSIRGIATETRFQSAQRATGIYIDEIPMSDPFIPISQPDLAPFDLERIEVLKGPQGTLFGSMALAGAIHYITAKPEPGLVAGKAVGSLARVTEGGEAPYAAGMLNVPAGESAALRGAWVSRDDPAYVDDVRTGAHDIGGLHQRHGRLQGLWDIGDALSARASYLRQKSWHDDAPFGDQRQRLEHGDTLGPSTSLSDFDVANVVATYSAGWAHLVSSTSRLTKEARLRFEASRVLGTTASGQKLYATADTQAKGFTQELRLATPDAGDRLQWLAGAWYQHYDSSYDQYILQPGAGPEPPPDRQSDAQQTAVGHYQSAGSEKAIFADLTFRIFDPWTVSVGGRLYRVALASRNVNGGLLTLASTGMPEQMIAASLAEKGVNPRISTSLRVGGHAFWYALAAKGFRFGGVQLAPPAVISQPPPDTYKSDTLWSYESGFRTDWFDDRLSADITAFLGRWKNLQVTQLDSTGLTTYVANIGSARTRGCELALSVRPFSGVSWTTTAAVIDARTAEPFTTNAGLVPPGTRLPGTPHLQFTNLLAYEVALGRWTPGVSVLHAHVGRSYNDLFATETLGDYDTIDVTAHLSFRAAPLQPEVSLGVTNVTDARGIAGAFATPTGSARDFYFITPRTVLVTTSLSF